MQELEQVKASMSTLSGLRLIEAAHTALYSVCSQRRTREPKLESVHAVASLFVRDDAAAASLGMATSTFQERSEASGRKGGSPGVH